MAETSSSLNPFENQPVGTLMALRESVETRYEVEIWFPYTREAMADIREGRLVAVRNFTIPDRPEKAPAGEHHHYTILEITSLLLIHYAVGEGPRGYPGFEQEARKSAAADWRTQETYDQVSEETTKIRCRAIPTNLGFVDPPLNKLLSLGIEQESNIPMLGEEVKLLTAVAMESIVNYGIDPEKESVIAAGPLKDEDQVKVYLRVEDLLRTHFGIFGYTGAGKSNLVSTLLRKLLRERTNREERLKLVVFDLMGEYTALLIDLLVSMQPPKSNAFVLCIGEQTLPGPTVEYLAGARGDDSLGQAVRDLLNTTYLPKTLRTKKELFRLPIQHLLESHKIRIWRQAVPTLGKFIESIRAEVSGGNMGGSAHSVNDLLDELQKRVTPLSEPDAVAQAISEIEDVLNQKLTNTAANNLRTLRQRLQTEHGAVA